MSGSETPEDVAEQPIEPEVLGIMQGTYEALEEHLPKGWGFALLIFRFGEHDDGRMNYCSNARREDMLVAMREFIASNEGRRAPAPGTKQ